ncbi:MAG: toxin-antitoxin system YwqK family antitoxin [Prolixibacteraceae bacterium]|jgi:antitoxin component YwqK of YwqJK toxin-antitoxin module|nr:toxin-antitoxin system YwqK family antitoxin [Prolixibacteraceae bacterium]
MKSLLLLLAFCSLSFLSRSQEAVNKTDPKGLKQGKWVSKYPGGSLKYEGYFNHNKPTGEWKRYHENGKIKALMTYRPNSERVFASLFDEEGKLYAKGVFEGTLRDSTWNFYSGEMLVSIENYHLGKKEGSAIGFDQNGKKIWERELKNDLLDGNEVQFDPSGIKRKEIYYKEGKRSGPALFYDENGIKSMEGSYLDDLSEGAWKIFDKDGKLKYQILYKNGEIVNQGAIDALEISTFKQYDKIKGKISEPKLKESGMP